MKAIIVGGIFLVSSLKFTIYLPSCFSQRLVIMNRRRRRESDDDDMGDSYLEEVENGEREDLQPAGHSVPSPVLESGSGKPTPNRHCSIVC